MPGKSLRYDRVSGKFCDHCAGTQMVFVGARGEGATSLRCHSAKPNWVDFSFWGALADGKRIEGRARTRLTFDAGYD